MTNGIGSFITVAGLIVMLISVHSWAFADAGTPADAEKMMGQPITLERLTTVRGMNNPLDLNAALDPVPGVYGNEVNYQGNVEIQQVSTLNDSFNQSQGVFTVVQNSGNNVMIQTLTVVNVNFK